MATRWNPQETVHLVHEVHGDEQRQIAEPSIRALGRRLGFTVFHTSEVTRLFLAYDAKMARSRDMLDAIFDAERASDHHDAQYAMAAHTLAGVDGLSAVPDLLASAVLFSANLLPRGAPPFSAPSDVNYASVLGYIKQLPSCRVVAPAMHALTATTEFQYLEALAERCRTEEVVRAGIWFDQTGRDPEPYRLKIPAFIHRGKSYFEKDVDPLLLKEGLRVQSTVQATMLAVNEFLRRAK